MKLSPLMIALLLSVVACQTTPLQQIVFHPESFLSAAGLLIDAQVQAASGDFEILSEKDRSGTKVRARKNFRPTPELTTRFELNSEEDLQIELAGWYNDGWDDESHARYSQHHRLFSEVNPYWYNLGHSDSGTLSQSTDGAIHERSYVYNPDKVNAVMAAHDIVVPTVGDNAKGQINRILEKPAARENLLSQLLRTVLERGYDGIDINFEGGEPQGQEAFADFVDELAQRLHVHGKRLSVTIKAAYSTQSENWEIFDYALLGQTAADRFKVMMYDHNFDAGMNVPGPIAEYNWMVDCLDYMIGRGLPAEKIHLGLHNYAWTWQRQSNGDYSMVFPHSTWSALKAQVSQWNWDATAKESWADFEVQGVSYRSYVGNVNTVRERLGLARKYGLAGIVFWTLGREDAQIYPELAAAFGA